LAKKSEVLQLPLRNTENPLKRMITEQKNEEKYWTQGESGARKGIVSLEIPCFLNAWLILAAA